MKVKFLTCSLLAISSITQAALAQEKEGQSLSALAGQFVAPPDVYKPHAWWHWLGTNYSKSGMTKDLQAMKEAGVGGVVVFNAPSWLDPKRNPWPEQTYRSVAYWDALRHALDVAKSLNMTVGIHNTPGWSSTGGPWITPELGMQAAALSAIAVAGPKKMRLTLPNPRGTDKSAAYFKDVAVMAAPAKTGITVDDLIDLTGMTAADGSLEWQVPSGKWTVYRFGYYPNMQHSHPTPEDVADYALEADKMNPEATAYHWRNVLNPLTDRFSEYIGHTFNYIWIDSYESGDQSWSPNFRKDFVRIKGYDPVPQIVAAYARGDSLFNPNGHGLWDLKENAALETRRFVSDYRQVINRLFLENYRLGKEMVARAGFRLCWEPYCSWGGGPFEMDEGIAIADIPVTEFWVHTRELPEGAELAKSAAAYDKRIVGAEAFTGMEATCKFNETPAMLKRPADMAFSYGVNQLFLHSWAHNPFDDKYQPGFNFAHYGTHFSRNQTWIKPGKAFFTYLSRCQMLLQQGDFVGLIGEMLHRKTPDADIFFVRNTREAGEKRLSFPATGTPELWDAYTGTITATKTFTHKGDSTFVSMTMEKGASLFVIFPLRDTKYTKLVETKVLKESKTTVEGEWTVFFQPKTPEAPFQRTFKSLVDWSSQTDTDVKYFSGTAIYEKTIRVSAADLATNKRIVLDLGTVKDMAEVEINGQTVAVLWYPPFRADITRWLKAGDNRLRLHVTNTWVNRLIGDEQWPEDFEWTDRNQGLRAMTGFPDWFVKGVERPVKERKTFLPWYYYKKDSQLLPAGLLGPVFIEKQEINVKN